MLHQHFHWELWNTVTMGNSWDHQTSGAGFRSPSDWGSLCIGESLTPTEADRPRSFSSTARSGALDFIVTTSYYLLLLPIFLLIFLLLLLLVLPKSLDNKILLPWVGIFDCFTPPALGSQVISAVLPSYCSSWRSEKLPESMTRKCVTVGITRSKAICIKHLRCPLSAPSLYLSLSLSVSS